MHAPFALAAPLALLLPLVAPADGDPVIEGLPNGMSAPQSEGGFALGDAVPAPGPLAIMRESSVARQVRIEQRVVIRIAPHSPAARRNVLAEMPQRPDAPRFEERGKEKCVTLDGIAGVQTGSGNRLVLFLRDRRMISLNLEKSCRARDFYSGFYVEKNRDGRLCVERDKLQSRTGARCEVETMRRLVAADG